MEIQSLQNNARANHEHSLIDEYLGYWISGSQNSSRSGLINDLTTNLVSKLEPDLANEYKQFITNFYNSMNSLNKARREDSSKEGTTISQLSEIIKTKTK